MPQRPLLARDDEKRLPGEHKKVFLVGSQWYIAIEGASGTTSRA